MTLFEWKELLSSAKNADRPKFKDERMTKQENRTRIFHAYGLSKTFVFSSLVLSLAFAGCAKDSGSLFGGPKPFDFLKRADSDWGGLTSNRSAKATNPMLLESPSPDPQAPEFFKARFNTSKGSFVAEIHRDWSPNGVDRQPSFDRGRPNLRIRSAFCLPNADSRSLSVAHRYC